MEVQFVMVASAIAAVYTFLRFLLHYAHNPLEPRPLGTAISIISPIIGMSRKRTNYYVALRYGNDYRAVFRAREKNNADNEPIVTDTTFPFIPFVCPARASML